MANTKKKATAKKSSKAKASKKTANAIIKKPVDTGVEPANGAEAGTI